MENQGIKRRKAVVEQDDEEENEILQIHGDRRKCDAGRCQGRSLRKRSTWRSWIMTKRASPRL